jgi:histone-lysine N-methyltransferase SETMAR
LSQVILPAIKQQRIHRPIILHDNARPHKHSTVEEFFLRNRWEQLKHPPYSPDLNKCDYDGIYRIKRPNKDIRFNTTDELERAYKEVINDINLKTSATGMSYLPLRWALVNQIEGEYIHKSFIHIWFRLTNLYICGMYSTSLNTKCTFLF